MLKYKDRAFSSYEEMLEVMKVDGIFEEEDDWQIQTYASFKEDNAAEFLRMAVKYKSESPPDMIQSSENLWLAVVYTVKLFYLNMDVHLASHRSLSFFFDIAIHQMSVASLAIRLDRAWEMFEELHSFAYGMPAITIRQFPEVFEEIKFFVEEFPKINCSEIQLKINNLVAEISNEKRKDIDFSLFTDEVKPKIGNKQFSPKYKFY